MLGRVKILYQCLNNTNKNETNIVLFFIHNYSFLCQKFKKGKRFFVLFFFS